MRKEKGPGSQGDLFGTEESNTVKCSVGIHDRSLCKKAMGTCRGMVLIEPGVRKCLHSRHGLRNETENREYLAKE